MMHYVIQTIAYQLFFIIVYEMVLKRETFFNWNRAYLLITVALSFIIPFIKISSFKTIIPQDYIIKLPEVFIGKPTEIAIQPVSLKSSVVLEKSFWSWELVFYLGIGIASLLFIYKLLKLIQLLYKNQKERLDGVLVVNLPKSDIAFSFFNYIFLGEHLKKEQRAAVLKHELVHVKHRHTLDLLFLELLRILFWFNPLVYIYQNKIVALHEFIADNQALKTYSKPQYYQSLLSQVFETKNISFINQFFKQSLIKKRIIMLQKTKSKQVNLLKFALLIPLLFVMLMYSSCQNEGDVHINKELSLTDQINNLKMAIEAKGEITLEEEKQAMISLSEVLKKSNKYLESGDVPFGVIEQVPLFPGCENSNEQKRCMSDNIAKHINKNFNTKLASEFELTGRQRINVIFKIDTNGSIVDVRARAPHPALEEEAKRVVKTLPKMIPGKHKGKSVNVPYSLPIIFQVAE